MGICEEPIPTNIDFWRLRAGGQIPGEAAGSPSAEDLRLFTAYADHLKCAQAASGAPGLVLGATLQTIDWCRKNNLRIAVMDFCEPVTRNVKSIHPDWDSLAFIIDNWLTTVHADCSFCWAAGDGVVNAVGSGRNAKRFFRQVYRLLLPGSIFVLRNILRPFPTPSTADVFAKLAAGQSMSFFAFRHQIAQSLQTSFADGILTRTANNAMRESGVLDGNPMERFAWPAEQLMRLDYWNIEGASLCYPTLAEMRDLADPGFEELDISYGDYELAELLPTIVYRRRS